MMDRIKNVMKTYEYIYNYNIFVERITLKGFSV